MKDGKKEAAPVADWATKRRWVAEAFARLEENGYHVGSAYTAAKSSDVSFLYRDALWHGADMLGLGVSSFSHLAGVHDQNEHAFEPYTSRVEALRGGDCRGPPWPCRSGPRVAAALARSNCRPAPYPSAGQCRRVRCRSSLRWCTSIPIRTASPRG
jgi:hypothetical protein